MTSPNWLDKLLFGPARDLLSRGSAVAARTKLNFASPLRAVDNPSADRTDVTFDLTDAGGVTGAAASTADDLAVYADTTGKVLARGLAKLEDAGASSPRLIPRVAGTACVVAGSDGTSKGGNACLFGGISSAAGGEGGDVFINPGPAVGGGGAKRGNTYVSLDARPGGGSHGAERALIMNNVSVAPSGGTPTAWAALYPKNGLWYAYGANGEEQISGNAADPFTRTTFQATGSLRFTNTTPATAGDIRGGADFSAYGVDSLGADVRLVNWRSDAFKLGDGAASVYLGATDDIQILSGQINLGAGGGDIQVSGSVALVDGSSITLDRTALGAASVSLSTIRNATAALVGAQVQVSPAFNRIGSAWDTDGAVAKTVEVRDYVLPVAGTAPYGIWKLETQVDSGGWVEAMRVDQYGIQHTPALAALDAIADCYADWDAGSGISAGAWTDRINGRVLNLNSGNIALTTMRGRPAVSLDGSHWLTSADAASTWKFLHDGTGCTIWVLFGRHVASGYGNVLGTCKTTGGVATATGLALDQNADSHFPYWDCCRNNATATFTTPDLSTAYEGVFSCTLRHKTGGTPNNYLSHVAGRVRVGAYAAAASSSDPDYTLCVGAEPAGHTLALVGPIARVRVWKRMFTAAEMDVLANFAATHYHESTLLVG